MDDAPNRKVCSLLLAYNEIAFRHQSNLQRELLLVLFCTPPPIRLCFALPFLFLHGVRSVLLHQASDLEASVAESRA